MRRHLNENILIYNLLCIVYLNCVFVCGLFDKEYVQNINIKLTSVNFMYYFWY